MKKVTANNLYQSASKLHSRTIYAAKIEKFLEVFFDKRVQEIKKWEKTENRNYRKKFTALFNSLLLRGLYIELCVIFDPAKKVSQYNIDSLLKDAATFIGQNKSHSALFKRPDRLKEIDFDGFLTLSSERIDKDNLCDQVVIKLMKQEYTEFTTVNAKNLKRLRYLRDKFLVHADDDYQPGFTERNFLAKTTLWCFCFVNLLMHLFTESGARHFAGDSRENILSQYVGDYSNLIDDLIS